MRSGWLAGVAGLALMGCGGEGTSPEEPIYTLTVRGGGEQQGPAGSELAEPLQVTVQNPANEVVSGVVVRFRVLSGPGSVASAAVRDTVAVSGFDGVAAVGARLGTALGAYRYQAYIRGQQSNGVVFRATATPPPTLTSVSPQSFAAGDTIEVRGTNFNRSLAGNTVYFGEARGRVVAGEEGAMLRVVVPPCVPPGPVQVRVQVSALASTNALAATYVQSAPTLALAPLEGLTVSGTELGRCLRLGASGARYLLVPQYAAADTGPATATFVLGSTQAGAIARRDPVLERSGIRSLQSRFDLALRAQERVLAREVAVPRMSVGREGSVVLDLAVGDARSFRVLASLDGSSFVSVTAKVRFIGENIILYVDEQAPAGGFTPEELERFGALFDDTLYPIAVRAFGAESDIDGNDRVIILMTPRVNGITSATQCQTQGFVTGYFFGFDLVSRGPNSNVGEVFYSIVPDPAGTFSCRHSTAKVRSVVPATFIHELQHMISFNQHVLVRNGSDEDVWLNEGLSHIAEELAARHYENLARFDSAAIFLRGNVANAFDYLANTAANSVTTFEAFGSLEERGAAWLFLRWLGDQKGDDVFARLVQTRNTSTRNIEETTGESFPGLFGDFGIALWADSIPGVARSAIPPRYRFHTRNLRRMFSLYSSDAAYPLQLELLPYGGTAAGAMVQGTSDYFGLATPAVGNPVALQFAPSAGGTFPTSLQAQLGIFRLPDGF